MAIQFLLTAFFLLLSAASGRSLPPPGPQTAAISLHHHHSHHHHPPPHQNSNTHPPPHHNFQNSDAHPPPHRIFQDSDAHPPPHRIFQDSDAHPPPPPHRAAAWHPPGLGRLQALNIIDAILGTEDFGMWANFFSGDALGFPIPAATLFLATDKLPPPDPSIIPYHTVPQRLVFADLLRLRLHSRLPTLLPSKTILVTNNSASNFTVDGCFLERADVFISETIAVHALNGFMDYTFYGDKASFTPPPPPLPLQPPAEKNAPSTVSPPHSGASAFSSMFCVAIFVLISGSFFAI